LSDGDEIRKLNATHHPDWLTVMSRTQLISGLVDLDRLRSLRMYPCDTSCLQHAAGEGWLAIGDAVAVWDPLSSGGVSKALRNGEQAAAAIFDELNGDRQAMMRYEDQCARAFTEYLAQRHTHYAIEKRWSADLFWRRRAA
jgi:flavin-dependent dehydrogenase